MTSLDVWMYGVRIGTLSGRRGSLSFAFTDEALGKGVGRPLLSVSMPTRARPYRGELPGVFFDGLLPEGEARGMIAYDFGLEVSDVFGLLAALGRDCAGALSLLPEGEAHEEGGAPEPISEAEIAERIRSLRLHPLGVDQRVRVSLAGMQEKLLLAKLPSGWGLPVGGAPSTHILKPANRIFPDSIANEALCLRIARKLGIAASEIELGEFAGVEALIIKRYDRTTLISDTERVVRIHQEDFCQARGVGAQRKYEDAGGPSLRDCAEVLRRWAHSDELLNLLDIAFLNVLVGNADAHAKNLSLLYTSEGQIRLAPAYDVMTTRYYRQTSPICAMFIDGIQNIDEIATENLVGEAESWGVSREIAASRVEELLTKAASAIEAAASEVGAPDEMTELLRDRALSLECSPGHGISL